MMRVSLAAYLDLVRVTQLATQDEMLGFAEHAMPIGTYSAICHSLVHCPTLEQALELLDRFYGVFVGCRPYRRERLSVVINAHSALQKSSPIFAQSLLLSCYKTLCWLADRRLHLSDVGFHFRHPAGDVLGRLFDCAPKFGAPASYITFSDDLRCVAVIKREADAKGFGGEALRWLLSWAFEQGLEQRIRRLIGGDLSKGFPRFAEVAAGLAMAPQTLSRKLAAISVTYRQIKDQVRRDSALAMLEKSDLTLEAIALKLGFSELSSFARAFQRWINVSPGEHRRSRAAKARGLG